MVNLTCPVCGHTWNYRGSSFRATCPRCKHNNPPRNVWVLVPTTPESIPTPTPRRTRTPRPRPIDNTNIRKTPIEFIIDRNGAITITCQLDETFSNWLKENGSLRKVSNSLGESWARNWDCNENTEYVDIAFPGFDDGDTYNIISDHGLNSFIIKLAGANTDRKYKVKYQGLVSKEKLLSHANDLKTYFKTFYQSYVTPVKIDVKLEVVG